MPHQIKKGKGPLAGHSKTQNTVNKAKLWLDKKWRSDKNPVQDFLNKRANIANTGGRRTAAGDIQEELVEAGHSKTSLRRKTEAHEAWLKARKEGKLDAWEKKYRPERWKAKQKAKKSRFEDTTEWD